MTKSKAVASGKRTADPRRRQEGDTVVISPLSSSVCPIVVVDAARVTAAAANDYDDDDDNDDDDNNDDDDGPPDRDPSGSSNARARSPSGLERVGRGGSGDGDRRGGGGNRRAMSDTKLAEEAALTALLFGGGGDGEAFATADDDEDDDGRILDGYDDPMGGGGDGNGDLFEIDRSGEDVRDDEYNSVEMDAAAAANDDDEDDDVEDESDADCESENDGGRGDKVAMIGAAWKDIDSEGGEGGEEKNFDIDRDDDDSEYDSDTEDEDAYDNARQTKSNTKRSSGGVSLVNGPNRLKKLRRHANENDPISFTEYEMRLRERFVNTASVASRTDWADVGLAARRGQQQRRQLRKTMEGGTSNDARRGRRGDGKFSADYDDDTSDEEEDAAIRIFESNAPLFEPSSCGDGGRYQSSLPPTLLDVVRVRDGNLSDPNNSVVSACQFHPHSDEDSPLLMTAGMDKMLRFFRVNDDGEDEYNNSGGGGGSTRGNGEGTTTKIHGMQFPDMPITCASFVGGYGNSNSSVVVSGRRPFFYVYDASSGAVQKVPGIVGRKERSLEKFRISPDGRTLAFVGNDGYVILVDGATRQWIGDLKMNGSARAIAFTDDGEYVLGSGSDGDVYR